MSFLETLLSETFPQFPFSFSPKIKEQLFEFSHLLQKWNQKINLTAHRTEKESIEKNFVDSLSLVPWIGPQDRVLDIGSGAGFPGILLKIVFPLISMVLTEPNHKKRSFLTYTSQQLQLSSLQILPIRIRQDTPEANWVEQFDTIVSRATISIPLLVGLAFPYLKKGGKLLAMGSQRKEEYKTESFALEFEKEELYRLPKSQVPRKIFVFRKK